MIESGTPGDVGDFALLSGLECGCGADPDLMRWDKLGVPLRQSATRFEAAPSAKVADGASPSHSIAGLRSGGSACFLIDRRSLAV
jgi:hypothetical protein